MIRIDVGSSTPLEEQIVRAFRQALAHGAAAPGEELPSVRQLAADLGVHWNTVARAYRRLADEGLLVVRRGRSVVVRDHPRSAPAITKAALRDTFADSVAQALLGGCSHDEIAQAFREALAGFGERNS
jgi:DNA-binding transcriptional regulator YhcF (GntR family)